MKRGTGSGEVGWGPEIVPLASYSRKPGSNKLCCPANEPDIQLKFWNFVMLEETRENNKMEIALGRRWGLFVCLFVLFKNSVEKGIMCFSN